MSLRWRYRTGFCLAGLWASLSLAQDATSNPSGTATFGTTVVVPGGLRGEIYYLDTDTRWLPKFEKRQPVGSIYVSELNVTPRHWLEGFPGISRRFEWFAIDYHGRFWIETPGTYRFSLESDDGSKLYIDERLLIDNDGQHPPLTARGRVELSAGLHDIRVSYFQGPRDTVALVLKVARPEGPWKVFNTNDFKPPPNPENWQNRDVSFLTASVTQDAERHRLRDLAALAALDASPRPYDFEFHVAVFRFASQASSAPRAVVFEISPSNSVHPSRAKGESNRVHFSLFARIKDADGQLADQYSADVSEVAGRPVTSSHPLILPVGRYTMEAAAVDRDGGAASTSVTPLDVPAPHGGIGLSSVMMVRLIESVSGSLDDPLVHDGVRIFPIPEPMLSTGTKPTAYFFVYPDKTSADKPKITVELLANGRVIAKRTEELPPPDAYGTIPMHLETPASPGNWELRITAIQGAGSVTESARYSIPAK
jgi:hypothetical protein